MHSTRFFATLVVCFAINILGWHGSSFPPTSYEAKVVDIRQTTITSSEAFQFNNCGQIYWMSLPAFNTKISPALSAHGDGRLYVVAIAPNGDVGYTTAKLCQDGWTAWQLVKPQSGSPALTADPYTSPVLVRLRDILYVFARGADNNLYKTQRSGQNDWTPWQKMTSDGSVRGRISVAFTTTSGEQQAHVVFASNGEVQYRRFAADGSPTGGTERWLSAQEGVIASDGSYEILALIRTNSEQMLVQRKNPPWGDPWQWQSVATLPSCLDISNAVYFGGAFHVAYVMKTRRDEIDGTYTYKLAHTRFRAGMYDDGYFRVLLEYQPQGNVHPLATLAVYRNKLVAAYTDDEGYVRYAYWDTADPKTPWIGMKGVASGQSRNRPALDWFNAAAYLSAADRLQANFGNDLFAVVRTPAADQLVVSNFSRAFLAQHMSDIGLTVDWCTNYLGPKEMNDCPPVGNLPPATEIPAYTEVGFGAITLPDWFMGTIFYRTMSYARDPIYYSYNTWVHTIPIPNAYFGPHFNIDYTMDYLDWHEEMGHRFATSLALWDKGANQVNPNLMSDLFSDTIIKGATALFGERTNDPLKCTGGSDPSWRCRGFTGHAGNYDVMSVQHSWMYVIYFYMNDSRQLRQFIYDDLLQGDDLLKRKYEWVRKYIFRGVEFNTDNEPLSVVTIANQLSGKALEVAGWSMEDHANIQQYMSHGGDNQRWALRPDGDGYYQLVAMHSGKCLDVTGVNRADGAKLQQYQCHSGDNQKWKLIPDGDGHFEIVAKHSGKCLDVTAWSTADGAAMQQFACHGGANQKWKLEFAVSF